MAAEAGMALFLDGIAVSYARVPACRDVSLQVASGECLAVVGANGAGKSSLVAAAAGLEPLAGGRVLLDGSDISGLPAHQRARRGLALVPENRHLFPEMTVEETLRLASGQSRRESGTWDMARTFALFPRLSDRRNALAGNLSGGERQMLAIARGLLLNPSVMMLDEPSAGLAPSVVEEVLDALRSLLSDGIAMLLVEQSIYAAQQLAHRVAVMQDGVVVRTGSRDLLADNDDLRRAYLGGH